MSRAHQDLVNAIRLYVSEAGGHSDEMPTPGLLYDRNGTPVRIGKKGTLDIAVTLKGRSVRIDAKIGKDRLKPEQVNYANAVIKAGGIAFAAWSVDDVKDRLRLEGLIDG